jgi:hypothetical protein
LTYAEVEGWPGYEVGAVAVGELVLEYDHHEVHTGEHVGLRMGDNAIRVVSSRTGTVRSVRVGQFRTVLNAPMQVDAGGVVNLRINLAVS